MNINFTEDQIEELKNMVKASKIRMGEWISEAKNKGNEKEAQHISGMLEKRKEFETHIFKAIKKEIYGDE